MARTPLTYSYSCQLSSPSASLLEILALGNCQDITWVLANSKTSERSRHSSSESGAFNTKSVERGTAVVDLKRHLGMVEPSWTWNDIKRFFCPTSLEVKAELKKHLLNSLGLHRVGRECPSVSSLDHNRTV